MTATSTVTAPAPAAKTTPATTTGGGIKETIESILVAFILAFVFRAFVVEAFVIPTGSMATTLLGAHVRFHCPDCGYDFDLNYSDPRAGEDEDVNPPDRAGPIRTPIYCPNCGFLMPPEQTNNPPVAYGDRILVLKYLYLLNRPKRWDVVVFKAPPNPNQNFIKRLTGLPGESVMILDGDVYVRPAGDTDPDPRHFVVQPKPLGVQNAMWRLVYDNDHHPQVAYDTPDGPPRPIKDRGGTPWQQPWHVAFGACRQDDQVTHGRTFTFDDLNAGAKLEFDNDANPAAQGLSDYLEYDQGSGGSEGRTPVSDVDVRLTYERVAGTGPFRIEATKRNDTFVAELTPESAVLYHEVGGRRTAIGQPYPFRSRANRPVRVELSNADYRVTLQIDGAVAAQTTPADYAPQVDVLLREFQDHGTAPPPTVAIRADDQQSRVTHLSLWRDVYYTNHRNQNGGPRTALPSNFPDDVQRLGADEYFTMGDNSQVSFDARCWPDGLDLTSEELHVGAGKVPGRFLLGKAFYVYWPAGYRAGGWLPALIPDVNGMRMIH